MKKYYKDLVDLCGIAAFEKSVRNYIKEEMLKKTDNIIQDGLGSIYAIFNDNKDLPTLMIAGHMDEVGFMVSGIKDNGLLEIIPIGGVDPAVFLSQHLDVITDEGKKIRGITGAIPPHLLRDGAKQISSFEEMFVDLGCDSKVEVLSLGIRIGNQVVPHNEFIYTANGNKIISKAWDDRFGVAMMLDLIDELEVDKLKVRLVIGANVQEEVGTRGAQTATQMIKPDVFIAVDCSPCSDTYKPSETGGSLGKGFMVRFYDPGIIMHQGAYKYVTEIANKNNISYQLYRAKGGTDAVKAQYAGAGAISFTIGMPARYIHTTASMISLKDYLEVKKELKAIIYDLDEAKINKIREE